MKKFISILAISVLFISITSVTAFAYGGRGGCCRTQASRYEFCEVENCDEIGIHEHDDVWYYSRLSLQGEYEICPEEGCALYGINEHDGVYYRCSYYGNGRGFGRLFNR